jgi:ankyrin repeat protein
MSWAQLINADCPFKWNVYPRYAIPLYYASSFGITSAVQHLLSSTDLNAPGSRFGGTALHAATIRNHIPIMELLLAAGADPCQGDFNLVISLHSAASQGNMATIEVLILRETNEILKASN